MNTYRVVWEIDIEADSAVDAAQQALVIQRDPESIATVFVVSDKHGDNKVEIDLHDNNTVRDH